jgi:transglutaminase-like putative cysteine protease
MKLKVAHTTVFEYDAPVYETATELRLHPGIPKAREFSLSVTPQPTRIYDYADFYGNTVHHFNLLQSHRRLEIVANMVVETAFTNVPALVDPRHDILLLDFLAESRYVRFDPALCEFARSFQGVTDRMALAEAICREIHEQFVYETGVTGVHSTSSEVMNLRRGVCQDFAHVMLAACRWLGVPARYVSGYFYGGVDTEAQDRASHAWCEIYCGPEFGWWAYDPTHQQLFVDERYIKIGTGRDYADVTLVRGTFKGNATEKLGVTVRISAA